ncbi:MAG: hypothetical protein U5Q44_04950 [Dehalococcoidia bacterium]|nr:hypothetical protein [Dehalococcoidia bacterium]
MGFAFQLTFEAGTKGDGPPGDLRSALAEVEVDGAVLDAAGTGFDGRDLPLERTLLLLLALEGVPLAGTAQLKRLAGGGVATRGEQRFAGGRVEREHVRGHGVEERAVVGHEDDRA